MHFWSPILIKINHFENQLFGPPGKLMVVVSWIKYFHIIILIKIK